MTTGIFNDQNMEKQIQKHMGGCMAGFFNLFDRNHVLSGKRVYIKRLPASVFVESTSDSVSSFRSPALSMEFERPEPVNSAPPIETLRPAVTEVEDPGPVTSSPARSRVAVESLEFKEGLKSPWKFSREAPRLSLDSRAVVDAKGKLHRRELKTMSASVRNAGDDEADKQKRSPSVIARLMGLDQPLPSYSEASDLPVKKVELRRSASESRTRDVFRYVDGNVFSASQQNQSNSVFATVDNRETNNSCREFNNIENLKVQSRLNVRTLDLDGYNTRCENMDHAKPWTPPHQQRKGHYDASDFFPEPKRTVTVYSEIEKRLKMRGIGEQSQDLETLKQIFEALQLKGLLHHKQPSEQVCQRNFIYEPRLSHEESPIEVTKTARNPRRLGIEPSPPVGFRSKVVSRRNSNIVDDNPIPSVSSRSLHRNPNLRSPDRSENRSTSPMTTRKRLIVETQRRKNETPAMESRRVSSIESPRNGSRRMDQMVNQSPRRSRTLPENRHLEDESSTISESNIDAERLKMEDLKEGKSLLKRCDELLNSIAEITELQPSPVSVLDSSFYKEESSPSPIMKRTIDFEADQIPDLEDDIWSPSSSVGTFQLKSPDTSDDQQDLDFTYVSEILTALNNLSDESDTFLLLEKQQSIKGKRSRLKRKLIFDTVIEILNRHRQLPPWKSFSPGPELRQIWSEIRKIHVRDDPEDLFEMICGVMKRDMVGESIQGWGECHVEISDAVLDIERLIFKDLVGEMINSLAVMTKQNSAIWASRRKLVF